MKLVLTLLLTGCLSGYAQEYNSGQSYAQYARSLRNENRNTGWKLNIVSTVFWIGESAGQNNPVHNYDSSWDTKWMENYGGTDSPNNRTGYLPAFKPNQNPFYIALPYNDLQKGGTKNEAQYVIPWFNKDFTKSGKSVCKGKWIAIRKNNRVCYAQWEDVGPFRTDHWQYVFGNERPSPNINKGAGIDLSPAVQKYLGANSMDAVDWRFVNKEEVPAGPWVQYGENNDFVQDAKAILGILTASTEESKAKNATPAKPRK